MTIFKGSNYAVQHRCCSQNVNTFKPESFSTLHTQLTCQHSWKGIGGAGSYIYIKLLINMGGSIIALESANEMFRFCTFVTLEEHKVPLRKLFPNKPASSKAFL